jgi:hypothetical protein
VSGSDFLNDVPEHSCSISALRSEFVNSPPGGTAYPWKADPLSELDCSCIVSVLTAGRKLGRCDIRTVCLPKQVGMKAGKRALKAKAQDQNNFNLLSGELRS